MEIIYVAPQTVAAGASAVFNDVVVCGNSCIGHRAGSGLVTLRGLTQQCKARYRVSFGANIAIPTGGTVGPISLALAIDGEAQGSATAIVTPAAVENFFNVSGDIYILVDRGCCVNVSVKNPGAEAITVSNLNLIAERIA